MSEPLTAAQRVAIARHPQRPNITDYIQALFTDFFEQKGDRLCGEPSLYLLYAAKAGLSTRFKKKFYLFFQPLPDKKPHAALFCIWFFCL